MRTTDLYSVKDITNTRQILLDAQGNNCAITGLPIEKGQAILEHAHDSQMLVRGVTSRQANSALGVCENMWVRYMQWWYPRTLPEFLKELADYIQKNIDNPDTRYRHNSWLNRSKTDFNKLSSKQQDKVLSELGSKVGKNLKERKELFSKIILDRNLGYDRIKSVINEVQKEK